MLSLTIPVWLLVIVLILIIGTVLFVWVGKNGGGAYDFFTPMALLAILFVTVAIVVGILLGMFVF